MRTFALILIAATASALFVNQPSPAAQPTSFRGQFSSPGLDVQGQMAQDSQGGQQGGNPQSEIITLGQDAEVMGQPINQFLNQSGDFSQDSNSEPFQMVDEQTAEPCEDHADASAASTSDGQPGDYQIDYAIDMADALDSNQIQQDENSNYTILTEPLVIPVEANIVGSNSTIKPKINVLLYGKIPKNMPLINLKLSVGKDFLNNFDEFGNPKPGFKIDLDKLSAANLPDVLPRPEQPKYVEVGERKLVETNINRIKPAISVLSANDEKKVQPAENDKSGGWFGWLPFLGNKSAEPTQANPAQAPRSDLSSHNFSSPRRAHRCTPVPKIGHPVLLMAKLFKSIRTQFSNLDVENKLVFEQQINGVYYLIFKSVARGHVPQFFGLSFDSNTSQVINFATSPNLTLITSQLGIAQVNPTDEIECGNLSQILKAEIDGAQQFGTVVNVGANK